MLFGIDLMRVSLRKQNKVIYSHFTAVLLLLLSSCDIKYYYHITPGIMVF